MDTLGETTLESILAFVALKIEISWQKARIDAGQYNRKGGKNEVNVIEATVAEMNLLN
jgi:hypothetical protein